MKDFPTPEFHNLEHKIGELQKIIGTRTADRIDKSLDLLDPEIRLADGKVSCDYIQEDDDPEQDYMIGVILYRMMRYYIADKVTL